jgi:7-carboxy-7-deazaguanine synthase
MGEEKKFPIIEIFGPVLEGEGEMVGTQTMFIRTGGCNSRCVWCDTLYAVLPSLVKKNGTMMDTSEILVKLVELSPICRTVTISGGNPCIHELGNLVHTLKECGYTVLVETQGDPYRAWLTDCDIVTLSPKPPSSGEKTNLKALDQCVNSIEDECLSMKIVVFDNVDYEYAMMIRERYRSAGITSWFLQPGTTRAIDLDVFNEPQQSAIDQYRSIILDRTKEVIEMVIADPRAADFRVMPQLHALIFGDVRGV